MRAAVLFLVALVAGPLPAAALDPDIPLSAASASFIGEDSLDYAGWSVASGGDVNNDGFDDILIGADENDDGADRAGKAYLVLGRASGWSMDTPLSGADASFLGEDAGDHAGGAVASAGDVDGDGLDEILIGATWRNQWQGKTYLLQGREAGWALDTDLATADASFVGEDAYDYAGFILSSGDVNGDGYSDPLISAAYDSDGGSNAGQTYLILATAAFADCDDGLDNDGDGFTDFVGGDPGCADAADLSERSPVLVCDDGADDDNDSAADYPADIGCKSPDWPTENPECDDGVDNADIDDPPLADWDGAGLGNPDPECLAPWDKSEAPGSRRCGIGAELALLLPPLMWLSRRRGVRRVPRK